MAIDEKKLLEELEKLPYINENYDKENANLLFIFGAESFYEMVVDLINEQPKISLENKTSDNMNSSCSGQVWIPVSEKLPEDVYPNKQIINVLVTNDKGNVRKVQRRFDGYPEKVWHWSRYSEAIAWMPLPPKYEVQDD